MRSLPRLTVLLFCLAGCGDWPDLGPPSAGAQDGWPELRPYPDAAGDAAEAEAAGTAAEALLARAAALRARAAALRVPVGDEADFEALRARLAAQA